MDARGVCPFFTRPIYRVYSHGPPYGSFLHAHLGEPRILGYGRSGVPRRHERQRFGGPRRARPPGGRRPYGPPAVSGDVQRRTAVRAAGTGEPRQDRPRKLAEHLALLLLGDHHGARLRLPVLAVHSTGAVPWALEQHAEEPDFDHQQYCERASPSSSSSLRASS